MNQIQVEHQHKFMIYNEHFSNIPPRREHKNKWIYIVK